MVIRSAGQARRPLTARQREVLDFVRRFAAEHGYPPTVREIGADKLEIVVPSVSVLADACERVRSAACRRMRSAVGFRPVLARTTSLE